MAWDAKGRITDFTNVTDRMADKAAVPDAASFLRRISDAVRTGAAPDPNDMLRMANAFDRMLGGEPADKALDLKPKPGQRSWATRTALDQRDRLLREAAERFLRRHVGGSTGATPPRSIDALQRQRMGARAGV